MKHLFFSLLTAFVALSLNAQTYYYERVTDSPKKDGHYITLGNGICYESDKDGYTKGQSINYIGDVEGKHKYRGNGSLGGCIIFFSSDYSQMEMKMIESGEKYTYNRLSEPSNKTTALRGYREPTTTTSTTNSENNVVIIPAVSTPTVMPVTVTTPQKTWHPCHSCGGSGICKYCHGTTLDPYTKNGRCGVCLGTGRCAGCRGERGATY